MDFTFDPESLALEYGTPLHVLDRRTVDTALDGFIAAFPKPRFEISYAAKALALAPLLRRLAARGIGVDVCSLGELRTAEVAGLAAERITFHGCGKSEAELDAVRVGRAARVVVDNLDELQHLAAAPCSAAIVLRINTAIEAHTHEFVHTSGRESKFGLDPKALESAVDLLLSTPHLRFAGLHSHIGSQIYRSDAFAENAVETFRIAAALNARGLASKSVILGGGFGVPMHDGDDQLLNVAAAAEAMTAAAERFERASGYAVTVGIEPGRAIVANAGTTLYRVMAVKSQFGRRYAIVDGGLYENPRPALYEAYHHVVSATRRSDRHDEFVVCGRTCENDELCLASLPADLQAGDLLAMLDTGAYTYSMASNYNRFERPALVAVEANGVELFARRESADELLRLDRC